MNAEIVLKSVLALLGLWFFQVYFWRDFRLDSFRDHVFSIRDRMFMFAASGGIGFDHPAYSMLRNRMNVVLRYTHEFTLTRMIVVVATQDLGTKDNPFWKWREAVKSLPAEVQGKMKEFDACLAVAMLQHMVFSSFFLYLPIRPLMFLLKPLEVRAVVEQPKLVSGVERLEADALEQDARRLARGAAAA
jgi:hypothetical protein